MLVLVHHYGHYKRLLIRWLRIKNLIPFCGLLQALPKVLHTLIHSSKPSATPVVTLLPADAPSVPNNGVMYILYGIVHVN